MRTCIHLALLALMCGDVAAWERELAALPDKDLQALIQRLAPARRSGDAATVLKELSPRFNTWSAEQLAAANEVLHHLALPPARELLVEARVQLALAGAKAPRASLKETLAVAAEIEHKIRQGKGRRAGHPALQKPPIAPADFVEYRRYLEDLHYLRAQLVEASRLARVLEEIVKPLRNKKVKTRLNPEQLRVAEHDYTAESERLVGWAAELEERSLELRVDRLLDAESVLRLSRDPAERLLAAYAMDVDGPMVLEQLGVDRPAPFVSKQLQDPRLPGQLHDVAQRSQEHIGDLAVKAQLLEEGIQWWIRGRYGIGPRAAGLMKHAQPGNLLAVSMPVVPMQMGSDPQSSAPHWEPQYDRRHLYIWQGENRSILYTDSETEVGQTDLQDGQVESTEISHHAGEICGSPYHYHILHVNYSYTYRPRLRQRANAGITMNDPRDVNYLVGFLEYGQALSRFDQLLPLLSPGELEAVEQIVQADERLEFDTNLSRRLEPAPTPLSEPRGPEESFRRHSLAWMMALARVELGAMLAAFTETPKPFAAVRPSRYEAEEYLEILLDGLRSHYLGLPPQPQWQRLKLKKVEDRVVLAMQRRLTLAVRFAEAVMDAGVTPQQAPAVASLSAQLLALKNLLEREIRSRLQTFQEHGTGERKSGKGTQHLIDGRFPISNSAYNTAHSGSRTDD